MPSAVVVVAIIVGIAIAAGLIVMYELEQTNVTNPAISAISSLVPSSSSSTLSTLSPGGGSSVTVSQFVEGIVIAVIGLGAVVASFFFLGRRR